MCTPRHPWVILLCRPRLHHQMQARSRVYYRPDTPSQLNCATDLCALFQCLTAHSRAIPAWLMAAPVQADAERREQRRKPSGHQLTLPAPLENEYDDINAREEEEARARVRCVARVSGFLCWLQDDVGCPRYESSFVERDGGGTNERSRLGRAVGIELL